MKKVISTLVLLALAAVASAEGTKAKNVILMISDGLGFNGWEAARNYEGALPYDNAGFDFYGCSNDMLKSDGTRGGYDGSQYWSDFSYQDKNYTDSAAAATALYSGTKTYGGAIGVDYGRNSLTSIAQYAAYNGKSTGAISSVEFSHATPAAVASHNISRNNYADIANEMIYNSDLDVIMGAGLDANGQQKYVGGLNTAAAIKDAATNGTTINDFTVMTEVSDFQALANGTIAANKVLGATYGSTIGDFYQPGQNDESIVPTLNTMTKGALNILSQNDEGFFLMVEGGAVDWQNHANLMDRMMNEQLDFDNAVASTMSWIEANGGWEDNLLIITADHETGGIWGSDGYTHVGNPGEGIIPTYGSTVAGRENLGTAPVSDGINADVIYNSGNHTNSIVPLWAKGAGSDMFAALVDGVDAQADAFWSEAYGWDWDGSYIDNTDVFEVMFATEVPEPCTVALLGLGGLATLRRRRNV